MDILLGAHIGGGVVALAAGAGAAIARKGGTWHARAGTLFTVSMLFLGVSATILDLQQGKPGVGGVFTCYFIATAWAAARRRDGTAGRFEIAAGAVAFLAAALIGWGAIAGTAPPTPVGMGPVYAIGLICLIAGALDFSVVLRRRVTPVQRISRHLWRMCAAFFIATGSFFLGQQDALPAAVRGSPVLLVLAFAPFALMAFWLIRLNFGKRLRAMVQALPQRGGASA